MKVNEINIWELERLNRMKSFDTLLDEISAISSKEKILWKEIYDNCISDRSTSSFLLNNILMSITSKPDSDKDAAYQFLCKNITELLTRMEKINAQLIKLAEMIQEVKFKELNEGGSVFDQLEKMQENG